MIDVRRMCRRLVVAAAFLTVAGAAHPGVGIVRDSRGSIFYTDLTHVWKISHSGERTIAVRNVHTHELFVDSLDILYGEHLWYEGDATKRWGHRVWKRSPDGTVVDVIPARSGFRDDHDEFHFVQDARGHTYWADRGTRTVIRRRDPRVGVATLAEVRGRVGWMTVTPDGALYFMDDGDLRRISADGSLSTIARNLTERRFTESVLGDSHDLMGLWTDIVGNVYVASLRGRMVKRIDPHGAISVAARTEPPWGSTGGLVDSGGDLWLLECSDNNAVRVRQLRNGATVTTYQ